ncbi:type II secretion system protein M [Vibrio makurazakiensis]|uniref:MSHA biogenesis protein MshJ n=1 Tax=Vibrio makurazakiensis TaxID=2910250 RepID=UPI003D0B1A0F
MNQKWSLLNDKFANLTPREKWLVTICVSIALVLSVFTVLIEPSYKTLMADESKLTVVKQNIQKAQGELMVVKAKLQRDPDKELNIQYKSLLAQSQDLSVDLAKVTDGLISPNQMTDMLESVLVSKGNLKLIALSSLKPEPIESKDTESSLSGYYVHPVKIELTGSYFSIVEYLTILETLPMKYYWRNFQYSVEEYPQARLIFEVYTLGTRQEFIGG